MRFKTKIAIFIFILIAAAVGWYKWNFPTVTYRYRLTINVEVDGKVHSGSSVIGVAYSFNKKGLPPSWGMYNEYVSGQAVLIDIGEHGALVATLWGPTYASGLKYNNCAVDAGELVGRAHEPSATRRPCENGYPVSVENEIAISQMQGPVDLTSDNMPTFIWFADKDHPESASILKPSEFSAVIGDAARLVFARVEITSDPVVIDIDKRLPLYKKIPQPPRGGAFVLGNGLALHWEMFVAPWSAQ
jgi:hypothetical protein